MNDQPDIILLGYGVDDTLQLTVEAQRVLARIGATFTVGLPPNLARFLKAQRVECIDLAGRFEAGRSYADCYLDVADAILRKAADEPPAVFLTQGSPLFLNSINRFLVMQARERKLTVQTLPALSAFDAIVSDLGLDVGTFGLQLFNARRLVARRQQVNPEVPLLLLQLAGFAAETVEPAHQDDAVLYQPLAGYLRQFYPAEHAVTLVNTAGSGRSGGRQTVELARFAELIPHITSTSNLFVDAVRQRAQAAMQQRQEG